MTFYAIGNGRRSVARDDSKGLGMTAVVKNTQQLAGIFTDGDLRRLMEDN